VIGDPQRIVVATMAVENATRNVPIPGFGIRKRIAEDVVDALNLYDSREFVQRSGEGYTRLVGQVESALQERVSTATREHCIEQQHQLSDKKMPPDEETPYVVCQRCEDFLAILYGGMP
jgi:hypothetical protein